MYIVYIIYIYIHILYSHRLSHQLDIFVLDYLHIRTLLVHNVDEQRLEAGRTDLERKEDIAVVV